MHRKVFVYMSVGTDGGQKRASDSPRAGVTNSCELPDVSDGNQIHDLCKTARAPNLWIISPAPLRSSNYGDKLGLEKRPWNSLCFFNTVPERGKHKEQISNISHNLLPAGAWETYRHPGPFPGCSELDYPWRQMFTVFGQPGWHAWVAESTLPLNPGLILYPYIQR